MGHFLSGAYLQSHIPKLFYLERKTEAPHNILTLQPSSHLWRTLFKCWYLLLLYNVDEFINVVSSIDL